MNKCENCIHVEVCCYVSPTLPVCDSFIEKSENKFTTKLVWHSCTTCPPEENYNPCLYVTDGHSIMTMRWKKEPYWTRFENGGWYIEPGVNSGGYWWADLTQTIRNTKDFTERKQ